MYTRNDGKPCEGWIPYVGILKEEAIKYVKLYLKKNKAHADIMQKHYPKGPYGSCHYLKEIEWIKHFFNITEEDFKNGN